MSASVSVSETSRDTRPVDISRDVRQRRAERDSERLMDQVRLAHRSSVIDSCVMEPLSQKEAPYSPLDTNVSVISADQIMCYPSETPAAAADTSPDLDFIDRYEKERLEEGGGVPSQSSLSTFLDLGLDHDVVQVPLKPQIQSVKVEPVFTTLQNLAENPTLPLFHGYGEQDNAFTYLTSRLSRLSENSEHPASSSAHPPSPRSINRPGSRIALKDILGRPSSPSKGNSFRSIRSVSPTKPQELSGERSSRSATFHEFRPVLYSPPMSPFTVNMGEGSNSGRSSVRWSTALDNSVASLSFPTPPTSALIGTFEGDQHSRTQNKPVTSCGRFDQRLSDRERQTKVPGGGGDRLSQPQPATWSKKVFRQAVYDDDHVIDSRRVTNGKGLGSGGGGIRRPCPIPIPVPVRNDLGGIAINVETSKEEDLPNMKARDSWSNCREASKQSVETVPVDYVAQAELQRITRTVQDFRKSVEEEKYHRDGQFEGIGDQLADVSQSVKSLPYDILKILRDHVTLETTPAAVPHSNLVSSPDEEAAIGVRCEEGITRDSPRRPFHREPPRDDDYRDLPPDPSSAQVNSYLVREGQSHRPTPDLAKEGVERVERKLRRAAMPKFVSRQRKEEQPGHDGHSSLQTVRNLHPSTSSNKDATLPEPSYVPPSTAAQPISPNDALGAREDLDRVYQTLLSIQELLKEQHQTKQLPPPPPPPPPPPQAEQSQGTSSKEKVIDSHSKNQEEPKIDIQALVHAATKDEFTKIRHLISTAGNDRIAKLAGSVAQIHEKSEKVHASVNKIAKDLSVVSAAAKEKVAVSPNRLQDETALLFGEIKAGMHNHVGEFKDLLTAEVHAALRAVRELENQKRSLQSDIAELMSFHVKQSGRGEGTADGPAPVKGLKEPYRGESEQERAPEGTAKKLFHGFRGPRPLK